MKSKNQGKVVITPRPPVGSGSGENGNETQDILRDLPIEAIPIPKEKPLSHEEALAPEVKLPKVTLKKKTVVKK